MIFYERLVNLKKPSAITDVKNNLTHTSTAVKKSSPNKLAKEVMMEKTIAKTIITVTVISGV